MKQYAFIFCILFSGLFAKSQTVVDSLNVTPNTFQKRTLAYFGSSQNDTVSLMVYNMLGQTILSLLTNSLMPSGTYQDSLIMYSHPDGMYLVRLTLGHRKTLVRKIIKTATAGIEELNYNTAIKIYPNPTTSSLFIQSKQNLFENSEIEITNYLGQTVLKQTYTNQIDVSKLELGFYNLKITTQSHQRYFSKFIKE